MAIKSKKLVLTFGTAIDTTIDLTVSNPSPELTEENIKAAMDRVVTAGVLGDLVVADRVNGAKYVIQQVEELTL